MRPRLVIAVMALGVALGQGHGARAQDAPASPSANEREEGQGSPGGAAKDPRPRGETGGEEPSKNRDDRGAPSGGSGAASADPVERARELFAEGIDHVRSNEWGEALADFRASAALRPHAVTTYNMGASYRATGRYTRARQQFLDALARHAKHQELPPHLLEETRRFLAEIDAVLARVPLRVTPRFAKVTVDGAPLKVESLPAGSRLVAGVRPAGTGEAIASGSGTLLLDPGAHVLLVSAEGHQDTVVNRTVSPGDNPPVTVALRPKPSQLRVRANTAPAQVFLDGDFLGMAPLEVLRPAGSYELKVVADEREPFTSLVQLESGKAHLVSADLMEESPSVLESWWFWTAAGVVVTGAVIGTYFATRPEPERPPLDGGGLGWIVPLE
jgi:hypothetical protein